MRGIRCHLPGVAVGSISGASCPLSGALGTAAVGVTRLGLVVGLDISSGGLGDGGKLANPWNSSKNWGR